MDVVGRGAVPGGLAGVMVARVEADTTAAMAAVKVAGEAGVAMVVATAEVV